MEGITPDANPQYDGVPLDPPPSMRQGFGAANLGRSLPIASNPSGWSMQVIDRKPMATSGQADKFCLTSTGGTLRVTLVWADPQAAPAAALQLVNDLDLVVHADSLAGRSLHGNGAPDHLNNVEQVVIPSMGPGLVVILVTGFNIPQGPQKYSLVVQGNFNGTLQSTYNPAWNGATSLSCDLPVPYINSGPATLSNRTSGSFNFTTVDVAPLGFECQLNRGGVKTPPPLYAWAPCTSPVSFSGITDGSYLFEVRGRGFTVQDSRIFAVDTAAPRAVLTAASAPVPGATRSAAFAFSAQDASPVSFSCRLSVAGPQPAGAAALNAGLWRSCINPQAYTSLPSGNWTFDVRATDGAGNAQVAAYGTYTWQLTLPAAYVALTGGLYSAQGSFESVSWKANSGRSTASFAFQVAGVQTQSISDGSGASTECALQPFTGQAPAEAPVFLPCTSPVEYTDLQRGTYLLSVQLTGGAPDLVATSMVTVDTAGPSATITSSPGTVVDTASVAFAFTSPDGTSGYQCELTGGASSQSTAPAWANCTSPKVYDGLADGSYMFQVAALSASGDPGYASPFSFTVDTSPPAVSQLHVQLEGSGEAAQPLSAASLGDAELARQVSGGFQISGGCLNASFTAFDGVLGSGLERTMCQMEAYKGAGGDIGTCAGAGTSSTLAACEPGGTLYSLQPGTYIWSIVATDMAGVSLCCFP
ncbi:probable serine protease/ABC transporter B family protein tagA at N-terminal half [Coccomyxa sp. Obi]|nr:probable serine protease/ABC transporter B family protein tagA at N-terminal half [Coccomyxa sp. Obi]